VIAAWLINFRFLKLVKLLKVEKGGRRKEEGEGGKRKDEGERWRVKKEEE